MGRRVTRPDGSTTLPIRKTITSLGLSTSVVTQKRCHLSQDEQECILSSSSPAMEREHFSTLTERTV